MRVFGENGADQASRDTQAWPAAKPWLTARCGGYADTVPELPDVEGFRRELARHAVDRVIERVDVLDAGVLHDVSARRLRTALRGRKLARPRRHGKWLIVPVDGADGGPTVLLHFGMTGSLYWVDEAADRHKHDRVVLGFDDGELRYRDMRKLQGLRLLRNDNELDRVLDDVAPDALTVSRDHLGELLTGRRRQVKPALIDQSLIAGLGNLLADEVLWRARIHPRRPGVQLAEKEISRLHNRMSTVLRQSIECGRVPPRKSWLTGRRDEESGSCPRCGTTLSHGRVGGRGTVWCPKCQQV